MQNWREELEREVQSRTAELSKANRAMRREIAERKRIEREIEAKNIELEAKNAELERFTYTVSHDLKSPLITIKGFLGRLEKHASDGSYERLTADMGRIGSAADKMQALLHDLLELSRIGGLAEEPEEIPMHELIDEALQIVEGAIAESSVRVQIAPDLPMVRGDRRRLLEVLQNLIENAAKFMGEQAEPMIEIGVRHEAEGNVLFVKDNGVGINPPYLERVFGLFNQLDQTIDGTGIGLAIVKRIVELHGGRIWVESAGLGQGCCFCFTLANEGTPRSREEVDERATVEHPSC